MRKTGGFARRPSDRGQDASPCTWECVSLSLGRSHSVPESFLVPASLYGDRNGSKVRYAVQYTPLTLKPHATDTKAPNVMNSRQHSLVTFCECHVRQPSASHRTPCRTSYLSNLSPHPVWVDKSQTGRCPSGFVVPSLQAIQVTEIERRTAKSYGNRRSFA